MRTGLKFSSFVILGILCLGSLNLATASAQSKRKAKKPVLPTLPSGPLGPVPQVPLDSTPAVAPHVSYNDGQLTIIAPNSTLGDILRAVRKQTAAEMEIPSNVNERVVTQLGPGPARAVVAELLNGSRFNYVLLGSPADSNVLTRVVLVAKTGPDVIPAPGQPLPGADQAMNAAQPQPETEEVADAPDAEAPEENAEDNSDQTAEVDQQPQATPDQQPQGVKTPQQMLQEMQQRQLQLQQQQPPGQPPVPGAGYPQVPRTQPEPPQ